jgi:transposase
MEKRTRYTMTSQEIERVSVMKRLESRDLDQRQASEILGVSVRQIKRLWKRYRVCGSQGLVSLRVGGNRAFTQDFKGRVLMAVHESYSDFKPTFAAEKLLEREHLSVNHETLRCWMMEDGLWKGRKRKKARIHQSRERRAQYGELVQIDGSPHAWFEGRGPKCCALVFIDDATSRILHLRFEPTETTFGYFRCIESYVKSYGLPGAFYSDKHSIFFVSHGDKISGLKGVTQFKRAMDALKIQLICAHSPQAKGRVERANETLQDRLVKEMRLRGISTLERANAFAPEFIKTHNKKFAVEAANPKDAHRVLTHTPSELKQVLSHQETRKLSKNLELSYNNKIYQIQRLGSGYSLRYSAVTVCEYMDGSVTLIRGTEVLKYKTFSSVQKGPKVADCKEINAILDEKLLEMAA